MRKGLEMMKSVLRLICGVVVLSMAGSAYAELQNVSVGGQIRIRGRYWNNAYSGPDSHNSFSPSRVTGRAVGPNGIGSVYSWDSHQDVSYMEQRTAINLKADFTDNVSAFIELDSYDVYGEDFRSQAWLTGEDARAASNNDVEVFQSYVQVDELAGLPLSLKVGRQTLKLGKGWLVGEYYAATGWVSFDGIRLTYKVDDLTVDAFWTKVAETMSRFGQEDADFYGLYASYKVMDELELAAYYYYLRDDRTIDDSPDSPVLLDYWEGLWALNDYSATNLHTVGMRANGKSGALDYDLELAYQFGQADGIGAMFDLRGYGDSDAEYSNLGADLEVGYSFDFACKPRIFMGGSYMGADDNRDRDFLEYLNPFYRPEASTAFNRLFTSMSFNGLFDTRGGTGTFSNLYQLRAGLSGNITESLIANLTGCYFWVAEPWDEPANIWASFFPWWTEEASDDMGLLLAASLQYNYSKDLTIKLNWQHLFSGAGMTDGNFVMRHGTMFTGGLDDNDADYVDVDIQLKF